MDHPAAVGQVFNIGSTEEVTIGELAEMVKMLTDSRSEIALVPYDEAYEAGFEDMPRRVPDLTKIGALIGYRPAHVLEQTLQDVIAYYRKGPRARARAHSHSYAQTRPQPIAAHYR
jgi:UDP-glucose 4-epimerase